ncbi:LAMI_0E06084g1_1 [Lachancea mirantina]|uniref:Actin cytoskeleton-regulatory complex protein PAN1 n=1 Tax=Lachancea mirantina TaxID=1230905 RepID=A0A1G4JLL2_9SACH|nr:LAMI_0E06084g1_1 [Lachancea mirantina]
MYNTYQNQGFPVQGQPTGYFGSQGQSVQQNQNPSGDSYGQPTQDSASYTGQQPPFTYNNSGVNYGQNSQANFNQGSFQQPSFPYGNGSQPFQNQQQTGFQGGNLLSDNRIQQTGQNPQMTGLHSGISGGQQELQPQQTGFYYTNSSQNLQPQQTGIVNSQAAHQQQQQPQQSYSQIQQLPLAQRQQQPGESFAVQPTFNGQLSFQSLQPQQTGLPAQSQEALQPLRPAATGFVNSFVKNGINEDVKIPNIRLSFITVNDQAKFEKLFRASVPAGSNTVSGSECRAILMRSGLSPSQLSKIWTLCDTSKAGELLFPEFALAMHLVNSVLQGDSIPYDLDYKTKNEVSSFVDAINLSIANGGSSQDLSMPKTPFDNLTAGMPPLQSQPTGFMPQTSFGMPLQNQITGGRLNVQSTGYIPSTSFNQPLGLQATGGQLQQQPTGGIAQSFNVTGQPPNSFMPPQSTGGALQAQTTGGFLQGQNTGNLLPQVTGNMPTTSFNQMIQPQMTGPIPSQLTGPMQPQFTGPMQPQFTGGFGNQATGLVSQPTGSMPPTSFGQLPDLRSQPTGYLPPSNFNPVAPLSAQKTGFGNNDLYAQSILPNQFTADNSDSISTEEKSLFYKIFETYDTEKKGILASPVAVEIFRKSGLNRGDLERIWNLCDTNNTGQLNKQEFALGMHLVYRRLKGFELPARLPPSLIPSSTLILDSVKNQLKTGTNERVKAPTKFDGLRFKNDDDDLLPSSRNRRRAQGSNLEAEANKDTIVSLKESIDQKKSQIRRSRETDLRLESKPSSKPSSMLSVEELKQKILALPKQSEFYLSNVPSDLAIKFQSLTQRLPALLSEISDVDNQITNAKIELYKLRNPSAITGSGLNGEITEQDRRKAKSKALLASRMAALTGKPAAAVSDIEREEQTFNEEVKRIREENNQNQVIIKDIQSSIGDIASSLHSALTGNGDTDNSFSKWELGVGVDPQVSSFIRQLNQDVQFASAGQQSGHSQTGRDGVFQSDNLIKSNDKSLGALPQESRASTLKDQARRKMNERLAKLGVGTGHALETQNVPSSKSPAIKNSEVNLQGSSSVVDNTDEDEEVRKLMEQLEKLKAKKTAEREKLSPVPTTAYETTQQQQPKSVPVQPTPTLSEAPRERETTKDQENDSWDDEPNEPQLSTLSLDSSIKKSEEVSASPSASASSSANVSHHEYNPFSRAPDAGGASMSASPAPRNTASGRNPFFKQTPSSTSSFDAKKAEEQRRVQRGLADDDDWSDDEEKPAEPIIVPSQPTPEPPVPAVLTAPSLPTMNLDPVSGESVTRPSEIPDSVAVPLAPPLPTLAPDPDSNSTVHPIAPPLPQLTSNTQDTAHAASETASAHAILPPLPKLEINDPIPAVPLAPPLPQINSDLGYLNVKNTVTTTADDDQSDVLSIPESVDSEEDSNPQPPAASTTLPPSGIPPPPPLP